MYSKYALFNLLILSAILGFDSNCKNENKPLINSDTTEGLSIDTNFLNKKNETALSIFIETFADSLNNPNATILPSFLKDEQFDYTHTGIWTSPHKPLPLRKLIFDKVNNCKSLILIIKDSSAIYKKKPYKQDDIEVEFSNLSFYDLAINRYKILSCHN